MFVNQILGIVLLTLSLAVSIPALGQKDAYKRQTASPAPTPSFFNAWASTPSGKRIPFRLVMENLATTSAHLPKIWLANGTERLELTAKGKNGDTLIYPLVVFDAELRVKRTGNYLYGAYVRFDAKQGTLRIPFTATQETLIASSLAGAPERFSVTFSHVDGAEPYPSVGTWQIKGSKGAASIIHGTFETTTGDYRYLEGELQGDSLWMSTFDGAHLFLFTARIKGDSIVRGRFYSTGSGYEVWRGHRNPQAKLPNPLERVTLKTGVPVSISVLDTLGREVTLQHPRLVGKPVILQISGTWCPNCMDETQFLSEWYQAEDHPNVEIVGLCFERKPDIRYWKSRIRRVAQQQKVPYLMGYAGPAHKDSASTRLPFVSHIEAFPTTIFLNRRHEVVAVHTGYSGPATGQAFIEFRKEFNELILKILQ